jgi:exodeoxyribonuclease VII large subunit
MTNTLVAAAPAPNRPNLIEYTVSELSTALKRRIEESFSYVRVRGEVSGFKRHSSGHCYLCLKDADAVIDAVAWRQTASRLGIKPEDGMEVVCTGRLTTFPGRSKYQLIIETMELAGVGALLKLLEERKQRLAAEGLFAAERKKRLPHLPEVIGVVTSPTGAVIRDILHRLRDRFPRHVLLWPVAVQGEGAAAQVAAAIEGFNALVPGGAVPRPDLLIVARGGGSLEDLMAFNEEVVVRAAAASRIPLISAVGHETDTTLIDFASDRRAPTPTAAAEMAVPVRMEMLAEATAKGARLANALARLFEHRRIRLEGLARGLPTPDSLLEQRRQRLDDRTERLDLAARGRVQSCAGQVAMLGAQLKHPQLIIAEKRAALDACTHGLGRAAGHFIALERRRLEGVAVRLRPDSLAQQRARGAERLADFARRVDAVMPRLLAGARDRLANLAGRLESHALSHEKVLQRGYAMVRDAATHEVLVAAAQVAPGAALSLEFFDGEVAATAGGAPRRTVRRRIAEDPGQGKLL